MTDGPQFKYVGTRPVRPDGVDKVTGRATFGADFTLPGMLYGLVLRSPHAHARIRSIDLSGALAIDGVHAAVSGADFPEVEDGGEMSGEGGGNMKDLAFNCMAREKALYHGHAVAAVAATSLKKARAALEAIQVDYEVLKPVLNLDDAMAENASLLNEELMTQGLAEPPTKPSNIATRMVMGRGDVEQGFQDADVVVEETYTTPTVHQGYIEPHACLATVNEGNQATIWCCTQAPFEVRSYSAAVCGMGMGSIRVIPSEIGGGFGGKTTIYGEPVALMLSKLSGRPVKMTMSREEVFRATGPASAGRVKVKIGAKRDGTITAMQANLAYEAGAFPGAPIPMGCMSIFSAYNCPNLAMEAFDVLVNKPRVEAYRAPGAPQAMYASECLVTELAGELGMDPIDLRLKNAADEGDIAPYGPPFGPIGLRKCLEAAKAHPNYALALESGQGRGASIGFWFNIGFQSSAEVHVNEDGTVTVNEGNPDIGGSRASMALMAAEELGIPYENIRVQIPDTDNTGYTMLTGGSRTTFATGMAVIEAARDVIAQAKARVAKLWDVDAEMVEWSDGHAVPKAGMNVDQEPMSFAEIVAKTAGRGPLLGQASLNARGAGPGFSVNFCDVEVDRRTGKVDVLRFTAIQDAGRAIHPSYVEGQLQGGAVQGLGWALNEEYVYDADGIQQNAGFLDYRIPVASDMPMIDTQIVEVPNPAHPYGVRGVGETPIVAPLAAAANAVADATGVRIRDLPLSPPNVLAALDEAQKE